MRIKTSINILFILITFGILGQKKVSNDINKKDDIIATLKKQKNDSIKKYLADQYIHTARSFSSTKVLCDAYYNVSEAYSHSPEAIKYADSIILTAQKAKENEFLAKGYLQKGRQQIYNLSYTNALKNLVQADNIFKEQKNAFQQLVVAHYIGLLKNSAEEEEEALKIFEKNILFFNKEENQKKYEDQYLKSLFALANGYNILKRTDSAKVYIDKGLEKSKQHPTQYLYSHFLLASGNNYLYSKEYEKAKNNLLKGIKMIPENKRSTCLSYFVLCDVFDSINQPNNTIRYLWKIDSIYNKNPQLIEIARRANNRLLLKYKEKKDTKNQLLTLDRILKIDSILNHDKINLSKEIVQQYEAPKALENKELAINKLQKNQSTGIVTIIILVIVSLCLIGGLLFFYKRNKKNELRFEALLNQTPNPSNVEFSTYSDIETKNNDSLEDKREDSIPKETILKEEHTPFAETIKGIDLAPEVIEKILERLQKFENSHKYITKNYTLASLAKELKTNSTYLSKIINYKKDTTFSQYLNTLRINYAVEELKNNKKLHSFTIKAIAKEFGFNTAQAFSNAFHKQTGIYPSYFIKKIKTLDYNT